MPTESEMRSRRDSWPPTQLRLSHAVEDKDEPRPLLDIDEDPLTYFLTPAPDMDGYEEGAEMMDFDAGIEDTSHPPEIVRSVSPSSLDGLSKPTDRASSPEMDSDVPSPDEHDDEDYVRLSPSKAGHLTLRDLAIDSLRYRPRSPVFGRSANALLSPASFPAPQARGRSVARGRRGLTRSLSARAARPGHLWREPSPDVWSIEEETEEELLSDAAMSDGGDEDAVSGGEDVVAAKPKKRVRFILPPRL